ncbi:MAG: HpcH/HpaI aldolase/citrate lyase family protein [Actinomycetota bacterium]|nr:HpcH/HpaI aldolase/citrate lyase family protein [Actinomycetota bacterium]
MDNTGPTPAPRLDGDFLAALDRQLGAADEHLAAHYQGDPGGRQPVHTVYVPADRADVSAWGAQALALLDAVGPDALPADAEVSARVRAKLVSQPIEDLRIDFEDGYGVRPDPEEDAAAVAVGAELARLLAAAGGPSFGGIRFKSLEAATRRRGLRTLDLAIGSLLAAGPMPDGFVVTLPKVTSVDQVAAMVDVLVRLETAYGLDPGRLRFEIQVETPQAVLGADGRATVAPMVHAAGGRCVGLHYGTYDYSAGLGIAAAYQSMEHPAADHAKAVMQVAAAGTGVRVSDGSTNTIPTGPPEQVAAALALHARLVCRSLERGFYQGWDLHPGHLVSRYVATYAFYRSGLPAAAERLRNYLGCTEGGVMDEPATAQALASFLTRGLHCGALDDAETGFDRATLEALAARRTP